MLKSKLNQDIEAVINLMGEQVSFIQNIKVEDSFFTEEIQGKVTDVVLSLDGSHQISVDGGDFFILADLLEFSVLN